MSAHNIVDVISSTKSYINNEDNKILSDLALREATSTATHAHAKGTFLVYNQNLYKVIAVDGIAIGDELVVGTNISKTDVGTELLATQGSLTFDETPTANSTNPVTSRGIKTAVDAKQDTLTFDSVPTASSDNPVKSGGVYSALSVKVEKSVDDLTYYYTKTEVDNKLAAAEIATYHPAGDKTVSELTSALLIAANVGKVYNATTTGTTTADFVEGAGKAISIGDNIAVVDVGTSQSPSYKFDDLGGLVDLTNYYTKSETDALVGDVTDAQWTDIQALLV